MMLTIEKTLIENDSNGELFIRYTPVLTKGSQSIRFAWWEVGIHEGEECHKSAVKAAMANAAEWLQGAAGAIKSGAI